ncbi:MAG: cache domain-containing protein [candidate division FCPU426 bacterium]
MNWKGWTALSVGCLVVGLMAGISSVSWAEGDDLAKESEAKAESTAGTKPTIDMIIKNVDKACELLEKEGTEAFPKFQGKDSDFIFAGTYIWIHDLDGIMLMHPIKAAMNGKPILNFKDANGKRFFSEMNELVKEKGAGWVDYMWPKPGEKNPSLKISYVKLCKSKDGKDLVAGCGVYNLSESDIASIKSKN